jgi:hypothetical protein
MYFSGEQVPCLPSKNIRKNPPREFSKGMPIFQLLVQVNSC